MEHTTEYTEALASANAMPAPTWHRLKVSDAEVMLPADQPIESCVSFELDGVRLVDCENEDFTPFDAALSAFQEEIDAQVSNQAPRAVETAAQQVEETGNLICPRFRSTSAKRFCRRSAAALPMRFARAWGMKPTRSCAR